MTTVNGLDTTVLVTVDTLTRFVAICRDNRTVIEEIFGEPFRGDFEEKPVRQLNLFLKRIGLQLGLAKIEKVAQRKIRYYAIPADQRATMTRLARSYLVIEAQKEAAKEAARLEGKRRLRPSPMEKETAPAEAEAGLLSPSILGDR